MDSDYTINDLREVLETMSVNGFSIIHTQSGYSFDFDDFGFEKGCVWYETDRWRKVKYQNFWKHFIVKGSNPQTH